jgi:hypothetical protein
MQKSNYINFENKVIADVDGSVSTLRPLVDFVIKVMKLVVLLSQLLKILF